MTEYRNSNNLKFKNIEFLRFIFSVLIVMFHFRGEKVTPLFFNTITPILKGLSLCNICVDFFFIISGFFLFYSYNKNQDTIKFALKRFLRLAPLVWIFIFCSFILHLTINSSFSFEGNLLRMFLLHNLGFGPITGGVGGHTTWFISTIFWVSIFYFYLAKILKKEHLNLAIWLLVTSAYGFILNYTNFKTGGNSTNIAYFINTGVLRGLGGIGLGYFINMLYKSGFLQNLSKKETVFMTILELYCSYFLIYHLLFSNTLPGKSAFTIIIIFSILFYLMLIQKGVITKILNKDIFAKLGAPSYAIYVTHPLIMAIFNNIILTKYNLFCEKYTLLAFIIEVLCAILLGTIIHLFVEKRINKYIKKLNYSK